MDTNTNEITNSTIPAPLSDAEMTDGITSIARLEELLSAFPKPHNSDQQNPNPNPNNPLTHYSNFARALTATLDESLIRHFVKNLNGLALLAEWWAHMADKHTDDVSKDDVSMTLLKLLEKVPVPVKPDIPDSEKIVNLLSGLALNADPKIKETASVLSERWRVTNSNTGTDGTEPELIKKEEPTNANPNSVKDETETLIPPEEREEEQEEDKEKTASDPSSPDSSSDSVPVPLRTSAPVEEKVKKTSGTTYKDDEDMDALEIARQVAIQVEEEVVNYRESLYSSPEQDDSEKDEKTEKAEPAQKDEKPPAAVENVPLTESKSEKDEKPATNTNNSSKDSKDSGLTSGTQNVDPVRLKESHSNKDGFEGLDLNENLCTDYDATEQGGPIHVSASKAVLSVPASPHRFETSTGTRWKGTVSTTSAFRPAGTGSGTLTLKRDSSFLGFDLNVVEQDDGEVVLPPSGDSSTEVSSERAKKLKLDLNRMDEDAEQAVPVSVPVPIDQRLFRLQARPSGDQSQSSASSSSQKNPNLTRDFDLNDDLSEGQGQDRKFINILGSKLTVNGNNNNNNNNNNNSVPVKQTAAPLTFHSFLGPPSHSAPYQPYQLYQSQMTPHPTNFLYQHNMVPAQNWYGQPSTSYSVPIQVPSHFTRQMVGPEPVPVQENGLSVGLSLNPFGSNPFRPSLDLNSGTGTGTGQEASSSSGKGFRQFFVQSHNGTVQEPVQNSVPVPGTGLRWKDPDSDYGFRQLI